MITKELRNLAKDPTIEVIRLEFLEKMESHLSTNLDGEKFKIFETSGAGGIDKVSRIKLEKP